MDVGMYVCMYVFLLIDFIINSDLKINSSNSSTRIQSNKTLSVLLPANVRCSRLTKLLLNIFLQWLSFGILTCGYKKEEKIMMMLAVACSLSKIVIKIQHFMSLDYIVNTHSYLCMYGW